MIVECDRSHILENILWAQIYANNQDSPQALLALISLVLIGDHMNATNRWLYGCGNIMISTRGRSSFSLLPVSLASNYLSVQCTLDYTTSLDHNKLILIPSTGCHTQV